MTNCKDRLYKLYKHIIFLLNLKVDDDVICFADDTISAGLIKFILNIGIILILRLILIGKLNVLTFDTLYNKT